MFEVSDSTGNTGINRNTKQQEMPFRASLKDKDGYSIYPYFQLQPNMIFTGYSALAEWILAKRDVCVDGYIGVDWDGIKQALSEEFERQGMKVNWIQTTAYLKTEGEIDQLVSPFLGTDDSVWGKVCNLELSDFYKVNDLKNICVIKEFDVNIVWGIGAAYADKIKTTLYIDIPKNELLFRMRGGAIFNLGTSFSRDAKSTYKRLYFVDWIVLNKQKKKLIPLIDLFVDAQWVHHINWISGKDLRNSAEKLSKSIFRPRPWFDPGVWGGQLMKEHFIELARDEENYAWSFEIIAPENGIVLKSGELVVEITFDTLMFLQSKNVLGLAQERFGDFFPIRFDFLDTFDGGNLSVQCHPRLDYIQQQFGEKFTQDETYYIMDCKDDAKVYLGFQKDIDPKRFKYVLEESISKNQAIKITDFVQEFESEKHQLFLIPNQTVHSSGKNNFVLEISATPYIFTFKMYDWLQRDRQGNTRPINIEHGFLNLDFSRKGKRVEQEFVSKPYVSEKLEGAEIIHYPTHELHYYQIHRFDITSVIEVKTNNQVHVLMLVEGSSIEVHDCAGNKLFFYYAETFIVPAAVERYRIRNLGKETAKVIVSYLK